MNIIVVYAINGINVMKHATYRRNEMIMSNENKERVIDVTASAQSNAGYWRVVKVDLEDGTELWTGM